MKTSAEKKNGATKPKQASDRKRIPSMLDPFTEQLLRMDDELKTIQEMAIWLKAQGIKTSVSNVSAFLASRRKKRNLSELRDRLNGEKDMYEAIREWLAENPNPKLETIIEIFKMLVLNLASKTEVDPELLALADKLARTAIRFVNDQNRTAYRTRKLIMEEAKHAEWVKCEQTRSLELCLEEAKEYPAVADLFRAAFDALKRARTDSLRAEERRSAEQAIVTA